MQIIGRLVDIPGQNIYPAAISIEDGIIRSVTPLPRDPANTASGNPASGSGPSSSGNPASGLSTSSRNPAPDATPPLPYLLPGFIDAHVHIESSLLIPSEFARLAVTHGTVATVSDPHEIANVCGFPGVEFMIRNGNSVPFHFNFGAPSCVPATVFETAGATLDAEKVAQLLARDEIKYLSEMMNFPGVLNKDPEVMAKIAAAKRHNKPTDGHAPGLRGQQAKAYIDAGIGTDHECFTAEEALDKLRYGMKILIREGSAARNFDALIGLLNDYPDQMMFCSDDKHPDSLLAGHIDRLCARAVAKGIDIYKVLKAACLNPVLHYRLDSGLLRPGDSADFILVEDLQEFRVLKTYIRGQLVAENGITRIASSHLPAASTTAAPATQPGATTPAATRPGASTTSPATQPAAAASTATQPIAPAPSAPAPTSSGSLLTASPINQFNCNPRTPADFAYLLDKWGEQENVEQVYTIEALDGQLITNRLVIPVADTLPGDGHLHSNPKKDILKIVVVNRYQPAVPVAKSFIRNFGLQRGAIASSVAHDSHNIVAVGVDDDSLCRAVNLVIAQQGGLSCVDPGPNPAFTPVSEITGDPIPTGVPTPSTPPTAPGFASPTELILPLPVAGLMSMDDGYHVAEAYTAIDRLAKSLGSTLAAPFMTLSFMALLVIPHLKLSDLGLFDGDKFTLL